MILHILNGDALFDRFNSLDLPGGTVVNRECLIEGDLHGDTLPDFFQIRARYLSGVYKHSKEKYFKSVVSEFTKLIGAPKGSEFNFWFGYDLFCQANLWFLLSILHKKEFFTKVFIVYPSYLNTIDRWKDFGGATTDNLKQAFANRIEFSSADVSLANELWTSYKNNDLNRLKELSLTQTQNFPYLAEVVQAHLDRFAKAGEESRPEKAVEDIIKNVSGEFPIVFREFYKREGVYGFGDSQVKKIYDKINEKL